MDGVFLLSPAAEACSQVLAQPANGASAAQAFTMKTAKCTSILLADRARLVVGFASVAEPSRGGIVLAEPCKSVDGTYAGD